jgi:hypothetical protein
MKKVILSLLGLTLLAGCSGYDYYKTNVRYRQNGRDCIYYYTEKGQKFNEDIRSLKDAKQIVYRNVRCQDLYMDDTFGYADREDRRVIVPAFVAEAHQGPMMEQQQPMPVMQPVMPVQKCGCNKCGKKQVLKNRYVIVPAYAD